MLDRDHSRSLSPHVNGARAPRPPGQPSAEGAADGRVAGSYQLSPDASLGPGLGLRVVEKNPVLTRAAVPGGQHGALRASEPARARALAASSTCAKVQTLVSGDEASDKFHLSVCKEKYPSAFYLWPWSLVMPKGKDGISLHVDFQCRLTVRT